MVGESWKVRATHNGLEQANRNKFGLMPEIRATCVIGFNVHLSLDCVNKLSLCNGAILGYTIYLVSYLCKFFKRVD